MKLCSQNSKRKTKQKIEAIGARHLLNISMRFYEFSTLKPIKPLNPAQYAIASKKRQVDQAKNALKRETDAQKRKKEQETHWNKLRKGRTIPA